ncbi:MAG: hypothetical protein ACEQSU_12185 [Microgenomates group bacterium]
MTKNKHGLSRSIPEATKRRIRQDSGFGCVICAQAFTIFEHIFPEYADAKKHDPKNMTLLCHQCAGKHTRKQLSKSTIWETKKNPKPFQNGFSHENLDIGIDSPLIEIGPIVAKNCKSVLSCGGVSLLSISAPEKIGGPFRLSAIFKDIFGKIKFEIVENEWRVHNGVFDIRVVANRTTLLDSDNKTVLQFSIIPPNSLKIEILNITHNGFSVICDHDQLWIETLVGKRIFVRGDVTIEGGVTALECTENGFLFGTQVGSVTINSASIITQNSIVLG